jgi:hypothetical protein
VDQGAFGPVRRPDNPLDPALPLDGEHLVAGLEPGFRVEAEATEEGSDVEPASGGEEFLVARPARLPEAPPAQGSGGGRRARRARFRPKAAAARRMRSQTRGRGRRPLPARNCPGARPAA